MTTRLTAHEQAPSFTLEDAEGNSVSLSDYSGQRVILYFYPKANTPGCTTQACDFRDNLASLQSHGYQVVGISPDSTEKLRQFITGQDLTFPLLSDPDHAVAEAYGAWGEKKNYGKTYEGLIRSTFVIDEEGRIEVAQYNVRAKGHVAKLRRDLGIDSATER
ncbi:thioredoxin-dependent thiol peroxidase [Rothia sp. LK2588]|uniref:thioredoxin-dependent thiol peroxidase n=1 Tax=Rothia sp. LK2588 TaxID=3114369 RepID=UPI0034CE865D